MGNAFEIAQCITHCDPDGVPTGNDQTPGIGEPSFRFRLQSRNPQDKTGLVDSFIAVAEEIERLYIECSGAPWFPIGKYNAERTATTSTATGYSPIAPIVVLMFALHNPGPLYSLHRRRRIRRKAEKAEKEQQRPISGLA